MSTTATSLQNPFPGLRPFREDEEHLFFGRENQVDSMVDKLAAHRFLAVVGTSGSGKSSLVNSGLCPALHGGLMTSAGSSWRIVRFRPGGAPIESMARTLSEDGVLFRDFEESSSGLKLSEIVVTTLQMSSRGSVDIYEQSHLDHDTNLLIVVDQFEELFRYRQKDSNNAGTYQGVSEEAVAFVNLLLEAKNQTRCPIYVVLTMRSDFLGDCARFHGLPEAINDGQYLVPRMTRDERREAISGPVGVGGGQISPVLLTRLVNDVGDNPDQLSILQHALNRTWAYWQNETGSEGPLDLPHYEAIGSMSNALDQHAEQAFNELASQRKKQICERIFKALTDKATDPRGVRRPTKFENLCSLVEAKPEEVREVIDVFREPSRSFLMPPVGEPLEPESIVDISHESLMRVWKRLNGWADEEAESSLIYQRLTETSALHAAGKASLWQDPDLQLAIDWRDENQPNKSWAEQYQTGYATAMKFLDASLEQRSKKIQNERLRTIAAIAGITLIAICAIAIAIISYNARIAADDARKDAQEQSLAISAALVGDNSKAMELLEESYKTQKTIYESDSRNAENGYDYGNTLTALGNVSNSPSAKQRYYRSAVQVRTKLLEGMATNDKNWPEFMRRLADAKMNLAILEETKNNFDRARQYYEDSQSDRLSIIAERTDEKSKTLLDIGNCYLNLQGMYAAQHTVNVDAYFDAKDDGDKEQAASLKKLYKANEVLVEKYCDDATKTLKELTDQENPDALHVTGACFKNLGDITGDDATFEKAYANLVKIVKSNPENERYRLELENVIVAWDEDAQHKIEIAHFLRIWGVESESSIVKRDYFNRAAALLDQILEKNADDVQAAQLQEQITKELEKISSN